MKKPDADGKGSGLYDFSSLMGSDKKLLLKALPDKLPGVIRPETSETVTKIWKVLHDIHFSIHFQLISKLLNLLQR